MIVIWRALPGVRSTMSMFVKFLAAIALVALAGPAGAQQNVNVYSSRHYGSDEALWSRFRELTGITVRAIEGEAGPLLERLRAEGAGTPADVFLTVDVANIERARGMGLLQPVEPRGNLALIPAQLRDAENQWYALTMRARVLVYDPARVSPADVATYEQLADPRLRGLICTRSSNHPYNQSLTASIIAAHGEAAAEQWARGVAANLARSPRGGDRDQINAVASGECAVAIANTYYLGNMLRSGNPAERAAAEKVRLVFPNQADRGAHVNVSAIGVTRYARNREAAQRLVEFLASNEAQQMLADQNSEFPTVRGLAAPAHIQAWGEFRIDALPVAELARRNAAAVQLTDRAGWR
jgi:iron(III) transport system substrate-binding protein